MVTSPCTGPCSRRSNSEGVGDALIPVIQGWTLRAFAHGLWKKWTAIPDMYSGIHLSGVQLGLEFEWREQQGLGL